jgi:dTDP-4-dehydrorhamnose reductase
VTLRLLVFGRDGQVATELRRCAGGDLAVTTLDRADADLTEPDVCARRIAEAETDVVVNAAAYTAVDRAETEEALAIRVNGEAPGAMAEAARRRGVPFIHISTDYVFDGSGEIARPEDAPTAPINAYGRSKLAGERAVLEAGGCAAILRTSWVFSAHGANFVRTMLRVGAERSRITVVDDQIGGPTAAADIAGAVVVMARALAAGGGAPGVYHFSGAPAVSWCGFARRIFARAHWIEAAPDVAPIATEDWPTPAARPRCSTLDCGRIESVFGLRQPDWRIALDRVLSELAPMQTR